MGASDVDEPGLARRALALGWRIVTGAAGRSAPVVADEPTGPRRHVGNLRSMSPINDTPGVRVRGASTAIERVDDETLAVGADAAMEALALHLRAHRRTVPVWGTHLVQTLAGAVNTGTHGSSLTHPALASYVTRVELVDPTGAAHVLEPGHPDFPFVVLGLGCFGRVTAYHLRVRPRMSVERRVRHRPIADWLRDLPRQAPAGDRFVSDEAHVLFDHDLVLAARRSEIDDDVPDAPLERMRSSDLIELLAESALVSLGPRRQRDLMKRLVPEGVRRGDNIALQAMRMTTSRVDHRGHKDCELAVAVTDLEPALAALLPVLRRHTGHLWPFVHVRQQKADALPLSPSHGRDIAWLEFVGLTVCAPQRWRRLLAEVHEAFAPLGYRAHWAKECPGGPAWLRAQVPALARFAELRARYDPQGRLLNPYLEALLRGA